MSNEINTESAMGSSSARAIESASHSSVDTISFPSGTTLADLTQASKDIKEDGERFKKVTTNRSLESLKEQMHLLGDEQLEALKKEAEASDNHAAWSYGRIISSLLYASSSIICGAYLLSIGQDQGKNFILSGSVLVANTLMDHCGGWEPLTRCLSLGNQTIEGVLRIALPLANTIFTFGWGAHNLANLPEDLKPLISTIEKLLAYINLIVETGRIYTTFRKGQAERHLIEIQGKLDAATQKVEPIYGRNEYQTDMFKRIDENFNKAAKLMINGTSAAAMGAV